MPTKTIWVPPEIFLTHKGVQVYHTYDGDDIDGGRTRFRFTLDAQSDDQSFDARELDPSTDYIMEGSPPVLNEAANPAFATATKAQIMEWENQWSAWLAPGGALDERIAAVLRLAIDNGKLKGRTSP